MLTDDASRDRLQETRFTRRASRDRLHETGFTLLEVMIAMAILALALVTVFQSQSQSISMENQAKFATTASLLAQGKMAELEAAEDRDVSSRSGDFGDKFPDYIWEVEAMDSGIAALKRIDLVVKHQRLSANNTYRLVFYKYSAR
ncbi:MAG: prepilin-type N-terminal cleavage/methylation domain-containing protein [Deltaproteobacteria bacterium]|nr:prepilin-type N-terminal cleavage/methylation domain-containing protein [Deltaproteobacteria bacterium]